MDKRKKENKEKEKNLSELEACKKELEIWKEKCIRVTADLENFSRRIEKEKMQWMHIAQSDLVLDLLKIVDDFDRALQEGGEKELSSETKAFLEGFSMISKSLYKLLEKYDVIEITENLNFDPQLHEAIMQVDSEDHESGEIVQILQKGFMFKENVLRPAKVSVAK